MNLAPIAQREAYVAHLAPQSLTPGTYYTDVFDLSAIPARRVIAKLHIGTVGVGGTIDFKFQRASASAGPFYDIDATNCAITQLSAGPAIVTLEFPSEAVSGLSFGTHFFRGALTVQNAASVAGIVVEARDLRFEATSGLSIAALKEQVVYAS